MDAAASRLALAVVAALSAGCTSINLAPGTLAGTSWRVTGVNGQATPPGGQFWLRFYSDEALGARFGCNSMGGSYRLAGDRLTVDSLNSTLIGCPEPAASFETQGAAVLRQPMQVRFPDKQRMTLRSEAGTIAATRLYVH